MSGDTVQGLPHIEPVDVNTVVNENNILCDLSSDSGAETLESCSATYAPSSDSEISPLNSPDIDKQANNERAIEVAEKESNSAFPVSISPDSEQISFTCSEKQSLDDCNTGINANQMDEDVCKNNQVSDSPLLSENKSLSASEDNLSNIVCKDNDHLNKSTTSLNVIDEKFTIESTISRSADNLMNVEGTNELDTEQILNEFQNQKHKVAATQKILPDNVQIDLKSKIPKEILSQDLGSIVRNVHGIFSSVSGSLKNAYNNQRVTQKPVKTKLPQSKVLNDIFEDAEDKIVNNPETIPEITEIVKTEEINDNDINKNVLKLQIESLERVLAEQRRDNASLREKVNRQMEEIQVKDQAFKELEVKIDMMSKRTEQAQREKDAAVMRYASLECTVIEARKTAENALKSERSAIAEKELLVNKLKTAREEKQRICQLYDDKCHDLANSEKEVSKVREDLKELEGRLKWTQSKLRAEMDAYKESAERAEKLSQQVTELETAKETACINASDSARAKQLESELKESQAALILRTHEKEDFERRLNSTLQQLETCKRERDEASSALAHTQAELERVRQHASSLEEEAAELAALRAQAALADTLSSQLQRETELRSQAEDALNAERARGETCAKREAAALEHAARLTATHVAERARAAQCENTAQALAADNASLREKVAGLVLEVTKLEEALREETEKRNKETRVLARKVAELTEEAAEANKKWEWEKGEVGVLKKKHASAIKELNRELQRALKRVEQLEAKMPQNGDSTSIRTGSVTSLSSGESAPHEERLTNGHTDNLPDIQTREPDRQTLIERIVQLQRAAARRAERCEFLEEHSRQLTHELRGKARLLRHLLASLPAGAVASQNSDRNKVRDRQTDRQTEHSRQLTHELRGKARLLRHLLASLPAGAVASQNSDRNKVRDRQTDRQTEHSRQLTHELRGKARLLRHLLASLPAGAVASQNSDRNKVRDRQTDRQTEHSRQLTHELRGKARLLRHLLASLPAGAVASQNSDRNKVRDRQTDRQTEHSRQLTHELRGKARLLRHLLASLPAGAVASQNSDRNKVRDRQTDRQTEHSRQLTHELRGKARLLRHLLASLPAGAVASQNSDRNKVRDRQTDRQTEHSRQLTHELRGKARLLRHLLASLPAGAVASQNSDRNKVRDRQTDRQTEHSRQLTHELRGKARLLRHLLASLPAGAVASQNSDRNKKEIARLGGGAMAAVWGGDPNGISLELSLEINKKLQAVLEDTLLKNITLKENIDTLGEEIARLKGKKNTETN
ncbi:coiled-coil domain-containing protein 186 isoform X3 [Colias croceus]|uniref:coiled-coil domain-containing protein 186 isoform X3 n=1 Tax=Colias crocea TaxID=72248 RepID=UPI001E27DD90|nr:coiled-coil domain-containing protein 186 isoform X3 [Colias croceus]